jgi:hypothetical protein
MEEDMSDKNPKDQPPPASLLPLDDSWDLEEEEPPASPTDVFALASPEDDSKTVVDNPSPEQNEERPIEELPGLPPGERALSTTMLGIGSPTVDSVLGPMAAEILAGLASSNQASAARSTQPLVSRSGPPTPTGAGASPGLARGTPAKPAKPSPFDVAPERDGSIEFDETMPIETAALAGVPLPPAPGPARSEPAPVHPAAARPAAVQTPLPPAVDPLHARATAIKLAPSPRAPQLERVAAPPTPVPTPAPAPAKTRPPVVRSPATTTRFRGPSNLLLIVLWFVALGAVGVAIFLYLFR